MNSKILQSFEKIAVEQPDKICVLDDVQQRTRQQVMQQVEAVAEELKEYQHQVN